MSGHRFRSHACGPPYPGCGQPSASEPTRLDRSCSCPPPGPTPRRSPHDREPAVLGSAPTSPLPQSPQPTETDRSPVAKRMLPPTHHRLPTLGRSRSTFADPSLSRLGPLRLPLAGCPPSPLGRASGHSRTASRRQPSTDHPHSRHAPDHRDGARVVPPRAAERLAANPPPTWASTPPRAQPQHSPPTTPRYQEETLATPRHEPDVPPHEASSANPPSPATTTHPPTTATASHSPHPPHPGARTPADERRTHTRPPKQPPAHNHAAPTPQDQQHHLQTLRGRQEGQQTRRAPFRPGRSPRTTPTTPPPFLRHSHRPRKHQLTATTRPYRCCRCPAGGATALPSKQDRPEGSTQAARPLSPQRTGPQ